MTKTKTTEMKRSYLVQRLKKPIGIDGPMGALAEAFSFGGGRRNGGLSDEAMGLLRQVFRFDYMGAAEFEWGAVPEALSGMARDGDSLTAFPVRFPLALVPPNWRDKSKTTPTGEAAVYVLCRAQQQNDVRGRILAWAAGDEDRVKERIGLASSLRPYTEWDGEVCGWLELDNGFMFFTDRDMWASTCALFGVAAEAVSA